MKKEGGRFKLSSKTRLDHSDEDLEKLSILKSPSSRSNKDNPTSGETKAGSWKVSGSSPTISRDPKGSNKLLGYRFHRRPSDSSSSLFCPSSSDGEAISDSGSNNRANNVTINSIEIYRMVTFLLSRRHLIESFISNDWIKHTSSGSLDGDQSDNNFYSRRGTDLLHLFLAARINPTDYIKICITMEMLMIERSKEPAFRSDSVHLQAIFEFWKLNLTQLLPEWKQLLDELIISLSSLTLEIDPARILKLQSNCDNVDNLIRSSSSSLMKISDKIITLITSAIDKVVSGSGGSPILKSHRKSVSDRVPKSNELDDKLAKSFSNPDVSSSTSLLEDPSSNLVNFVESLAIIYHFTTKFSGPEQSIQLIVSTVFLRAISAQITNLLVNNTSSTLTRNIVLVSRVIQNCANGTSEFSSPQLTAYVETMHFSIVRSFRGIMTMNISKLSDLYFLNYSSEQSKRCMVILKNFMRQPLTRKYIIEKNVDKADIDMINTIFSKLNDDWVDIIP